MSVFQEIAEKSGVKQELMSVSRVLDGLSKQFLSHGRPDLAGIAELNQEIQFTKGRYQISLATRKRDLAAAFRLRYNIFFREKNSWFNPFGFERDSFDPHSIHIMIKDLQAPKASSKLVGYCRFIIDSDYSRFYSSSEFDLHPLKNIEGNILEMSRSCIKPQHRNGFVLGLIWRVILKMTALKKIDYIFGIPSVFDLPKDPNQQNMLAAQIYQYFRSKDWVDPDLLLAPLPEFASQGLHELLENPQNIETVDPEHIEELVPPLFKFYFRAGAKIIGEPAFDRNFACIDFPCLLKMNQLSKRYETRYSSRNSPE